MISQEPQSFRLPGPLSKAQATMGFVLLVLLLFPGLLAAASMKLLAPSTGWAAYGNKLYWTYNNGADWADITPVLPDVRREAVRSVHPPFFRDTSEGWTIVEYQRQAGSPQASETAYSVAHTVDSGVSWSFTELTYPLLPEWIQETVAAPANLFFIDSLHGWLVIPFAGLTRPGKLLATVDGGKTWNWVNNGGSSGPITFATLQDGWQLDFALDKLYVTHDGCKTWREVSGLPLPPQVSSGTVRRLHGLPIFQDRYKGYLVIQYLDAGGGPAKLVVYSTSDTGKSWQPAKVLDQAPEAVGGIFDIVDSTIIVSTGSSAKNVSAATVPLNGGTSGVKASDRGIATLKFADKVNGWMLTAAYRLLATQDGGSSWKDITPPSSAPALRQETVPIPQKGLAMIVTSADTLASGAAASASTYGSNTHVSKHLGFDMSYVRPAVPDMQTWWQYSPYYDIYIYLPGALNQPPADPILKSDWVTQVKNQGWGVIPIWAGLQAPKGCPDRTFNYYMDPDPATAAAQGKSEADSAANAADALGLSNTVIYKDIENYDNTISQCSNVVIPFVSAWVSELHAMGYSAGVYANPDPANYDIWTASPVPDEIWVADYDNKATIWHVGHLVDTLWVHNQRSHQYVNYKAAGAGESYNGVAFTCLSSCIDRDIDDAPAGGTNGQKTYSSWTLTIVDYPDSPPNTGVLGINSGYMHQVNNTGQPLDSPTLVGIYCVQCTVDSPNVGFSWTNGSFTSVNNYVSGQAKPFGVNNLGQIVGWYYPNPGVPGPVPGFFYDPSNGVTPLNEPNAAPDSNFATTQPHGINDASQVAGSWVDTSNNVHGFLYDNGWTSLDHSGTKDTEIRGINGIGQLVGYYVDGKGNGHGFVYSNADGWTNFNCAGQSSVLSQIILYK